MPRERGEGRRHDRTGSARRGARRDRDAGDRFGAADAGRPCSRRRHLVVPGAHPDPGNDARVRAEDPRHLHRDAGRASVHERRPACAYDAACRPHRRRLIKGAPGMRIDASFLPLLGATAILMFARIGTMVMLLPGLGELSVPARVRLTIALVLTAVLFPLHRAAFALDLKSFGPVLLLLGQELFIGVVLGLTARLTTSALQVAGSVVAQQLGLGFVTAVDPTQGQQGVILGNFLSVLGITLVFVTDLHYLVIAALNDSYSLFRPGEIPIFGDIAALFTQTVASAFRIGIQLAAPFLVFGLLFNLGLGVLARLMPQMQVFFVGLPLSILLGFLILFLVVAAMMTTFLGSVEGVLREL